MTIYLDFPAEGSVDAALDAASIVSIRASHAGFNRLPVVTVTGAFGATYVFRFADTAARDRFLLQLVDACEESHAANAA